jgi:hypothetical protein
MNWQQARRLMEITRRLSMKEETILLMILDKVDDFLCKSSPEAMEPGEMHDSYMTMRLAVEDWLEEHEEVA